MQTSLNLLFQRTLFLMFAHFQKYLKLQARTNKLVIKVFYHPCHSRLASGIHLSYFFKLLRVLSLKNACWVFYSNMCGKHFPIYDVHIPRKCIESVHLYSCPSPPLKTPGRIFWKSVSPKRKGWKKLWFALPKFNQKIWRWLGPLSLFTFCMICNFSKCDGFTVLQIISIKKCDIKVYYLFFASMVIWH